MTTLTEVTIAPEADGDRVDKALAAALPDLSRARIQALIAAGQIRQTGPEAARTIENAAAKVKQGQTFEVTIPQAIDPDPQGEDIPLTVVFEDEHLIIIDKPAGLVVHPGAGHATGTLVNALIAHCGDTLSGIGGVKRPGIVHRLDKGTSGLLVAAKTDEAHQGLTELFAAHDIERAYQALVWGAPRPRQGTVDAPIARSKHNRQKQAITEHGRHAITHYRVERIFGEPADPHASLVECRLETGRTHQIRVHLTHIGHAVIGDPVYGRGRRARGLSPETRAFIDEFGRQALHAAILGFTHPVTGNPLTFNSEPPSDMFALIDRLSAG
ncbi:MAG: RluA family pseudouridine synthase [Alphaproteobacteria bacterium]